MDKVRIEKLATDLAHNIKVSRTLIDREEYLGLLLSNYHLDYKELTTGYLNAKQFGDLVKLYDLLRFNQDIDQDNLNKILKFYPIAFSFLRKLNRHYENFATQLRIKGPKLIVLVYCGDRSFKIGNRALDI